MENKDELKELEDIQNGLFNIAISKPFIKIGRLELYFFPEYKFGGSYKLFKLLPDFGFIIDLQFKEGIPNRMKGHKEYTIFLDIFVWSFNLIINIENKELTLEEDN